MDFKEARELIKKGKKIKRESWKNKDFFLPVGKDYDDQPYLDFNDIDANDWIVYKKKVYCKTCGGEL